MDESQQRLLFLPEDQIDWNLNLLQLQTTNVRTLNQEIQTTLTPAATMTPLPTTSPEPTPYNGLGAEWITVIALVPIVLIGFILFIRFRQKKIIPRVVDPEQPFTITPTTVLPPSLDSDLTKYNVETGTQ